MKSIDEDTAKTRGVILISRPSEASLKSGEEQANLNHVTSTMHMRTMTEFLDHSCNECCGQSSCEDSKKMGHKREEVISSAKLDIHEPLLSYKIPVDLH